MIMTTFVRARCPTVPSASAKRGPEYIHTEYINWHLAGNSSLGINYLQTKALALAHSLSLSYSLSCFLPAPSCRWYLLDLSGLNACTGIRRYLLLLSLSASATNGRAKRRQAKRCKTQMLGINIRQQQQQQRDKTRRQRRWHPVSALSLSLPAYLTLSLCLDMCDPNVPLFVNSYKSPRRTQCDHCASKRRNKPTTRIGTDCAKPSEREMERGRRTKNKTRAQNGHINKFN